jgi:hypothetical protein
VVTRLSAMPLIVAMSRDTPSDTPTIASAQPANRR